MKKIFLGLFLVLILSSKVFAADYYFIGVDAFKKGAYSQAASNLEHAIRINPKNVNARYYLAQVYLMEKRIADAKTQYNRIIILAPDSDAAILSEKGLYKIQQSYSKTGAITSIDELDKYKDNYFDYVLTDGGDIQKWASFPLTVYIEPNPHKNASKKAFEQWQDKCKDFISFNFVDSPETAKITVNYKNKLESTSTKDSFIAGYSKPYYAGIHFIKSEIFILTIDPESKKEFDDNFVFATTLHELGHSLGFIGHSPNPDDVMSSSAASLKMELTKRDVNTMNIFYKIDKKTLLARKTGHPDLKLQQALDYIKKTPEKSVGWVNLGDIYKNRKMYSDAIKSYKKAIELEPDNANTYALTGAAYRLKGDKQNAYLSFKTACDLDKSNFLYLSNFIDVCCETGKKEIGITYVNSYIQTNPQCKSDPKVQNLLLKLK